MLPMFDLGSGFLASVARDPERIAVVDGTQRLSYRAWYAAISAVVEGLDALGLRPGDHVLTALQNRWEAATLHWACQFAGLIMTPMNWRATADDIDYVARDAEARLVVCDASSVEAVAASAACTALP